MKRLRGVAARVVFCAVIAAQLAFIVRAYFASHAFFGFQMFPESSRWRAEIVRVTRDGRRLSIKQPWSGYRWAAMVPTRGLGNPTPLHHADHGIRTTLAFLDDALDYVATHTPLDRDTLYLEARVTYFHNRSGPYTLVLRSRDRPEARP
jgi:hypothetical protein